MHYLVPNWCHCQRIFSRLKLSAATRQGHVGDVSVFAEWHSLCWFFALPLSPRSALIPSQWDVLLEQSALSTTELRCGFQRPIWVLPSRNWGFDGAQIQPDVAPLPLWPTQTGFTWALKPQCRSSIDQGVDSKPFPLDRAFKSGYFHRFFVSGDVITPVPPPAFVLCTKRVEMTFDCNEKPSQSLKHHFTPIGFSFQDIPQEVPPKSMPWSRLQPLTQVPPVGILRSNAICFGRNVLK